MSDAPTLATASETRPDLVNAALLGTDRRPLPPGATSDAEPDAAGWLLREAARRRAGRLAAGATTAVVLEAPAPVDDRPLPSAAARAVLDAILLHGSNGLVDLWLRAAQDAGARLAPEHWLPLLNRSRRATDLDRRRLAQVLGPRGLWCARHDPAWSLVVRAADTAPTSRPAPTLADLAALNPATPVAAARALGVRAGTALPLEAYASLTVLTDGGAHAVEPVARLALAAAEEVLWARWDLAHAFDPGRVPPDRRPVRAAATEERP